jgi:hypothetical protein
MYQDLKNSANLEQFIRLDNCVGLIKFMKYV